MIKVILPFICLFILTGCTDKTPITRTELIFDTPVTISIYDNNNDEILDDAFQLCKKYERKFSKTLVDSEVSYLNSSKGEKVRVSDELIEILEYSNEFSRLSNGLFDVTIYPLAELWDFKAENPTIPTQENLNSAISKIDYNNIKIDGNFVVLENQAQVDLGGIAKGYIAGEIRNYLLESEVEKAIINIGGNIVTIGSKSKDQGFQIGIQTPFSEQNQISAAIEITDMSVVTSGTYERSFTIDNKLYHHILDPKTGYPAESDMMSATIISADPFLADALSTTSFLLGIEKAAELIEGIDGVEAVFINSNNEIIVTSGIGNTIPITYY